MVSALLPGIGDPQGSQPTALIFFVLAHKDLTLKCYVTLNVFWKLLLPNQSSCYMTFYLNVQSKMYNGLQLFLFFSCWACFHHLRTDAGPSIHSVLVVLSLLLAGSDPSHHCLVRTHLHFIIPWKKGKEMRNWILNMAADQARKWLPDVLSTKIGKKGNLRKKKDINRNNSRMNVIAIFPLTFGSWMSQASLEHLLHSCKVHVDLIPCLHLSKCWDCRLPLCYS